MKNTPKVSVIIPVYNVETYLRDCLDSVCGQTYTNLEIICIDDGSTDGSHDILTEYSQKDTRIQVLRQENSGVSVARNVALEKATGEWVCSIDSDDCFTDSLALEKIMQNATDDVQVIHYGLRWFDSDKELNDSWAAMQFSGKVHITEDVITKLTPYFCDKLWKRIFLKECGVNFPLDIRVAEDLLYTRQCLSMSQWIYCLPDKLYGYRRREGSAIEMHKARKGGRQILDYIKVAEQCLRFWRDNNIRDRFGCSGPSHLEMELLEHVQGNVSRWAASEYQHEAWQGIKRLVEEYGLACRLHQYLGLARYYFAPPYIWDINREEVLRNITLLTNYRGIYLKYRLFQILMLVAFGERKQLYKRRMLHFRDLVNQARLLKASVRL